MNQTSIAHPDFRSAGLTASLFMLLVVFHPAFAAEVWKGSCDPGLSPAGASEVAYTNRGDRCEGIYIQEVSGGALEIVSFVEHNRRDDSTVSKPVLLQWSKFGNAEIELRASSLKPKLYYRMDTARPPKSASFTWTTDILSRLKLTPASIGILAWTEVSFPDRKCKVHLPLRVSSQPSPTPVPPEQATNEVAKAYQVAARSSVELEEVYFTLRPLDRDGRAGKAIISDRPVDVGYYPAAKPIFLPSDWFDLTTSETGLYSLEIGARPRNSELMNIQLWFFHANPAKPGPAASGDKP